MFIEDVKGLRMVLRSSEDIVEQEAGVMLPPAGLAVLSD
jgi:hypothetical protein